MKIVCLCGSTKFMKAFEEANFKETLAGNIVLSVGANMKGKTDYFSKFSEDELDKIKTDLDRLHLKKIDMADEILVMNVGSYVGESTKREVEYAKKHGKKVRWLEDPDKQL